MERITLTKKNAHRVTMVRRIDEPTSTPIPFKWRGERRFGIGNFDHLIGEGDAARIIKESEFDQWEVIETTHPGYLEEFWEAAYQAHYWSSQTPDIRGEDDIAQYENELHHDLLTMPENQREQYLSNYKKHISGILMSESRIASAFVTGGAGFNHRQNEKANNAYYNKFNAFHEWRERALKAVERYKDAQKTDEERDNELWQKVKADIDQTASFIQEIDTCKECGCHRSLLVSNIFGHISTQAKNGNVEIVDRAVARIREWNAKCNKPIITERHSFFKLPEVARSARKKAEDTANRENKEIAFEGGTVVFNYAKDRLQIIFDKIPDKEFRQRMHCKFRFNWSPSNGAWQRQLTDNAVRAARQLLGLESLR